MVKPLTAQPLNPADASVKPLKLEGPGDVMLKEGTPDDGTVDEYVLAIIRNIQQFATIPVDTRIMTPRGKKLIKVDMVHWEALRHVLTVLLTPGAEINDNTLRFKGAKPSNAALVKT
jgi:hypothetical protein